MSEIDQIINALRSRTIKKLPSNWRKGRTCPSCNLDADRPKCAFELGSGCPRLYPEEYEEEVYEIIPDPVCARAAEILEELSTHKYIFVGTATPRDTDYSNPVSAEHGNFIEIRLTDNDK